MFHGVTGENEGAFAAQLRYLARHFSIVPLEDMIGRLQRRGRPTPNEIALTFDDGLRNNFTIVYPMLRELRAPATFFVCPSLVEGGRWQWNHEVRCRLQSMNDSGLREFSRQLSIPAQSVEGIVSWMKGLGGAERNRAQEALRMVTGHFVPSPEQREAYDVMCWDDLRELDPALITIGSHTLTHPILTALEAPQLELELRESRRILERNLGRRVEHFCYPNGSYDSRVYQTVKRHYSAAVTTESGLVRPGETHDPHRLPRIPGAESVAMLAWRLHRPGA